MKVAIYARVSTTEQSHDSQLLELRAYCEKRGWKNTLEITDTISGAKTSRKGLDQLMALVRKGKVDVVLCYKLDRLGRSLPHLAQLISELDANRVALVVPSQGLDTSADNPAGRLQMHVLMAVAEFERSIIRDRVISGISNAKAKGVRFGRPEFLSQHTKAIRDLKGQGKSGREIAALLGIPASSVFKVFAALKGSTPEEVAA